MDAVQQSPRGRGGNRGFRGGGDGVSRGGSRGRSPFRGRGGDRGGSTFRGRGGDRGRSPFRGRGGGDGMFRGRGGDRGRSPFRGRGGGGSTFRGRGVGDGMFRGRGGDRGRSPFRGRGRSPFRGQRGGGDGSFRARGGRGGFRGRGGNSNHFSKSSDGMEHDESNGNEGEATNKIAFKPRIKKQPRPVELVRNHQLVPEDTKKSIHIANLPENVELQHKDFLDFIVKTVGPVKLLFYKKINFHKGAVVTAVCVFESPSDFKLALTKLKGIVYSDRHLLVRKFKDYNSNSELISKNCMLVTNLSKTTVAEDLWKLFEHCGKFGQIFMNYNRPDDNVEALVNFQNPKDLAKALKLNGSELCGSSIKLLKLDFNLSVVVSDLVKPVSSKVIETFLEGRNATYFRVDPRTQSRKKAFITFADKESYEKALTLTGTELKGGAITVTPATTSKLFLNNAVKEEVEDEVKEEVEDEDEEDEGDDGEESEGGEDVESGEEEEVENEEESGEEVENEEESGEEVEDEEEEEGDEEEEEEGDEEEEEEGDEEEEEESDESMDEDEDAVDEIISIKTNKSKQPNNAKVSKVQPLSLNNKRKRNDSGRGFQKMRKRN